MKPTILAIAAALAAASFLPANSPDGLAGPLNPKHLRMLTTLTSEGTVESDGCSVLITLRVRPTERPEQAFARAKAAGAKWLKENPGKADGQIAVVGQNSDRGYRAVTWSTFLTNGCGCYPPP